MKKFIQTIKRLKQAWQLAPTAKGFTLMEVVVATGIFVIMVLAILGIFTSVLKAQRNTIAQTRLEREAQLVMETIVKSIRSSRVDYDTYKNPHIPPWDQDNLTELILINNNDERIRYYRGTFSGPPDPPPPAALFIENSNINSPITSGLVEVTDLNFYIEPWNNPFVDPGMPPGVQPRVTIVLSLTSTQTGETAQATLQQTVPQRGGNY